jgi:hypothetical protein
MSTLTLIDLARAKVKAVQFAKAHPVLSTYHQARYEAMALAFGIRPEAGLDSMERADVVLQFSRFADDCASFLIRDFSPFDRYHEFPRSLLPLHQEFGPAIKAASSALQDATYQLLAAAIAGAYKLPLDATMDSAELPAYGFDPDREAPNEWDYW